MQTQSDSRELLRIYLNDHLAAAVGGLELARRCAGNNPDGLLGEFLAGLVRDVEQDHQSLRRLLGRLGLREDRWKQSAAIAGERAGRLKSNGYLRGYSPLSRLVELEALHAGIEAKRCLWQALQVGNPELAKEEDLAELQRRAIAQRDALEPHRSAAAGAAFAGAQPGPR